MVIEVEERTEVKTPKFRDPSELSEEQLTDPDYRLKQLAKMAGKNESDMLICSKCHHCR